MDSPAGQLLSHVASIDVFREHGFSIGLGDITVEEARALQILWSERAKYQEERDRAQRR